VPTPSLPEDLQKVDDERIFCRLPIHGIIQYDRFRPEFPLPMDVYQPWLEGSQGLNINHPPHLQALIQQCEPFAGKVYQVKASIPDHLHHKETTETVFSPNQRDFRVGLNHVLTHLDQTAFHETLKVPPKWRSFTAEKRIEIIQQFATSLENNKYELIALCINEAGKTWQDAIAEIREAIDFCHYYANNYRTLSQPLALPHTANERNQLVYKPKGTILCISPWNFPIAILVGQVVAALLPGNRVLMKPAPQTRICARRVFDLLINCGVPSDTLYFLPATNPLSQQLVGNHGIDGIAFTGSLATARLIQQELINQRNYPIPLVAETSGLNCMITDDSILTEQMVKDVVASAFESAGQRCSALRVLFLHESIYQESIEAIIGVMDQLNVDHPLHPATDLGPIIDESAFTRLTSYVNARKDAKQLLHQCSIHNDKGYYFAPALVQLTRLQELSGEHFGPILHVIKYQSDEIDQLIQDIEKSDYALTLGIHSRDKHWIDFLCDQLNMGNIYINRHITGAQVAAQPFGGHKKSGSGFKAGGPNYLLQFVNEQCISENIAAVGGNVQLVTQTGLSGKEPSR
jgi:RHH-type proline utilization regulon transcriptional repressor/proline dehydrogenase/delta 1-pyrroline-5-carboxylate dehydrogenase